MRITITRAQALLAALAAGPVLAALAVRRPVQNAANSAAAVRA